MARSRRPALLASTAHRNLFAGAGVAHVGVDFTDRAPERAELAKALRTPNGHLLLVGPRRIGKTSLLKAVADDMRRMPKVAVLYLDLWSASNLEDMTTRLATEAASVLGRRFADFIKQWASRLQFELRVAPMPSGDLIPVPTLSFRDDAAARQRKRLVEAFDALEAQAKAHKVHLGVILDEFQEIERIGRDDADRDDVSPVRQLRAAIQHHRHVSYVFAGSDRALIDKLSAPKDGPLHNLARRYEIGPIPNDHFAAWIDARLEKMGITAKQCGAAIIAVAGPRTRDVRTLAETAADRALASGKLAVADLDAAMRAVVQERAPQYELAWKELVSLQQNCLRAVAAGELRLTTTAVRTQFGLGDSSRVAKALAALVDRAILLRVGTVHSFDDPFFRAWIIDTVLRDVGLSLPITHVAQSPAGLEHS